MEQRNERYGIGPGGMFLIATVIGALLAVLSAGCSTISGFGRDLQDAANWTSERLDRGFSRPTH